MLDTAASTMAGLESLSPAIPIVAANERFTDD
jgi:hypothetical protein